MEFGYEGKRCLVENIGGSTPREGWTLVNELNVFRGGFVGNVGRYVNPT